MAAGLAPVGEVLAVVEQQVVVLLPQPAHGTAQADPGRGTAALGVVHHAHRLAAAEVVGAAAQDLASEELRRQLRALGYTD